MIIHWSLGDSKSPQVSRTLLSILAEKFPGDLRRLAVTQTPVKDHQLMLM